MPRGAYRTRGRAPPTVSIPARSLPWIGSAPPEKPSHLPCTAREKEVSRQLGTGGPRLVLEDYTREWGPEQDARENLEKAIKQAFGADIPEDLQREVIVGPAAPNLLKASEDAAMIVLGTRGRGGFKGLVMGSVSSSLAAHAKCPVLIHH